MKKTLCFIASCATLVVLADIAFGALCNWYLSDKSLSREYESVDYLIKRSTDDVIILGSSVALNGLMPSIIEDSLGMTCFNGAVNGQTLPFFSSMMECVLKRYEPQMIVLGLLPNQFEKSGVGDKYSFLMPYYGKGYEMIDSCMESRSRFEPYLLKSHFYRYNHVWLSIFAGSLSYTLYKHRSIGLCRHLYNTIFAAGVREKGFAPANVPSVFPELYEAEAENEIAEQRMTEFERMAERCQKEGVQLVVCFPPQYVKCYGKSATILFVETYCKEHNIPCFDDSQEAEFLRHKEWFYDNVHLNKNGAEIYTEHFIAELKEDSCRLTRRP